MGRHQLWLHLGWQDIKQRYRRSLLGPIWITIAMGTTAVAMGGLYSKLFHLELSEHLPYVTLGLIIWGLISASILEGAEVFVANEGLIKQLPTPLSVHVYRMVWRQTILFAHNIVIYVIIAMIFPKPWKWTDLSVVPALGLIMLNCIWASLVFGIVGTRFRDIGPLLNSIVQLLFFMTPIIWNDQTLQAQGAEPVAVDRRVEPAATTTSTSCGRHCSAQTSSAALDRGAGADGDRLDPRRVGDAPVPQPRAVLGIAVRGEIRLGDDEVAQPKVKRRKEIDITVTTTPLRVNSQNADRAFGPAGDPEHHNVCACADRRQVAAEIRAERQRPPQHAMMHFPPASSPPAPRRSGSS